MVVLYEHPLSPFAQKVKIGLREKGIVFAVRMPRRGGVDIVRAGMQRKNIRFSHELK